MTRALLIAAAVPGAALAQVAIAPLFPLQGAVAEFPVVVLLLLAMFAGPYAVMAALPVLALMLGFSTNIGFEWLTLAYLPLAPCAAWIQRQRAIPQTPYALALVMAVAAGVWARGTLAGVAMVEGASPGFGTLALEVILAGAVFDAALISVGYFLGRRLGWSVRSLDLRTAEF